ncbi:MAG: RHS repeat domain-containing protein, partial [Planctomycetota bacterium]
MADCPRSDAVAVPLGAMVEGLPWRGNADRDATIIGSPRPPVKAASHGQNPLAETTAFEYDADGNRTKLVAPGGEVAYYGYDALDRRTRVDFPEGTSGYFAYDLAGRRTMLQDPKG